MHPHKSIIIVFLLLTALSSAIAQTDVLTGRVVDKESREALEKATLQLYKTQTNRNGRADTTFVAGTLADGQGRFSFSGVAAGSYVLRASFLGYERLTKSFVKTSGRTLVLGDLQLKAQTVQISEAVVTANIPKMVIKDDTVVYNADAFRVPEGSVIESLVEMLPGAKVDDSGSVTINGKSVKKF